MNQLNIKNFSFITVTSFLLFSCSLNEEPEMIKNDETLTAVQESRKETEQFRLIPRIIEESSDVSGASVSLGIISPIDANGNVLVNSSGTTQVRYKLLVLRESASSDVYFQWQIASSNLTPLGATGIVRTLDFAANQTSKTYEGTISITASQVGNGSHDICIRVQDILTGGSLKTINRECENVSIPVPGIRELQEGPWIGGSKCAWDEYPGRPETYGAVLDTDVPYGGGFTYNWYSNNSNIEFKNAVTTYASNSFKVKPSINLPVTFNIFVRVSKAGYDDVVRQSPAITFTNCSNPDD